jgi:hypothetical protein
MFLSYKYFSKVLKTVLEFTDSILRIWSKHSKTTKWSLNYSMGFIS